MMLTDRRRTRLATLALLSCLGVAACSPPSSPSPEQLGADWISRSITPLPLSPIDITFGWNERAESAISLPPLAVERGESPGYFGHHWPERNTTLLGLVAQDSLDVTGLVLVVADRDKERELLIDFVETVTNQTAGAQANNAADIVDELFVSGQLIAREGSVSAARLRLEQRASGWWLMAFAPASGDPGLLDASAEQLITVIVATVASSDVGTRAGVLVAFTAASYTQDGDVLSSPLGLVRVEVVGDPIHQLIYQSELTHDDEVAEGLVLLSGVLDGLAEGAGGWVYERVTNRSIDETSIDDSRSFDGAAVRIALTQIDSGPDWGHFTVTFDAGTVQSPAAGALTVEERLRAAIPSFLRSACTEPEGARGQGLLITLRCETAGFEVVYSLYNTTANALRIYDINREFSYSAPVGSDSGDCGAAPVGETTWFDDGGTLAGRLTCAYTLSGDAEINWVHEGLKIYASVEAPGDSNYEALYSFWERLGPFGLQD